MKMSGEWCEIDSRKFGFCGENMERERKCRRVTTDDEHLDIYGKYVISVTLLKALHYDI